MVRKWNLLNLWFVCESAWQGVRDFHIYFYRLLCQIIHSFKHFIIIVLNRRYVGKCKYFYTNFVIFFRFCSVKHATMRLNPISIFSLLFFVQFYQMFYESRTWQCLAWLQPSVALYFIFMVSSVSDVAIYLHLIFFFW